MEFEDLKILPKNSVLRDLSPEEIDEHPLGFIYD